MTNSNELSYKDNAEHTRYGYHNLDNKTEVFIQELLVISYSLYDIKINITKRKSKARTGYCFYMDDNGLSIDYNSIGNLSTYSRTWVIICYPIHKKEAIKIIINAVKKYKKKEQKRANNIKIPKLIFTND